MKELEVLDTEGVAEDYFEVLGLLPTAPHELVTEAYWLSAHRFQGAASTDLSAQAMLVRLNQAYARLTGPGEDQRARLLRRPALEKHHEAVSTERRGWRARLLKRAPKPTQALPSHWELLHISPSASPEVVKLAYDFSRRQLRGSLGDGADPALERLAEAHQAIVAAASASPDQAKAGAETPDSSNGVQQQTADVQQQAANDTELPALEDSLINLGIDSTSAAPTPSPTTYVSFSAEINAHTTASLIAVMAECANNGVQHVYLLLSTPGGSVMHGMNLYNVLRAMPFELTTHNVGTVDAIGNAVFLAGAKRYATPEAAFIFSGVSFTMQPGQRLEEALLRERLGSLIADHRRIGQVIERHTNLRSRQVAALLRGSQTKDATYAVSKGIVHQIKDVQIPPGAPVVALASQP